MLVEQLACGLIVHGQDGVAGIVALGLSKTTLQRRQLKVLAGVKGAGGVLGTEAELHWSRLGDSVKLRGHRSFV